MQPDHFDLLIIGGGINGCGIARDAAGRGLKVALVEMGDLAQGTSSASTKLIHGGLRYLEHYAFGLVREALREREVLLGIAPHIVHPLRFILPQMPGMRPAWMLRLGLFIYDHLGGRKRLPGTAALDLRKHITGKTLKPGFLRGFEYSDCWVDDARLVILNAMDAAARGADILVQTRAVSARRDGEYWHVDVASPDGTVRRLQARALVNAGGAWVDEIARNILGAAAAKHVRLVKGSHIIVPKLFDHDRCYIFQNRDGRIVFAIPYEGDYTLIGTTDHDFAGDPLQAQTSEEEINYLLAAIGQYFAKAPLREDVVWSYSGVRALYDEGATKQSRAAKDTTREYVLMLDQQGPPLLSIYGGKITTYRTLAEAALEKLRPYFPTMSARSWTGGAPLPGGDFPADGMAALLAAIQSDYPGIAPAILQRMVRSYGTLTRKILGDSRTETEMGQSFGAGLHACEIVWLMQHEWARKVDDVLWRRSKLGLRISPAERDALARFMAEG